MEYPGTQEKDEYSKGTQHKPHVMHRKRCGPPPIEVKQSRLHLQVAVIAFDMASTCHDGATNCANGLAAPGLQNQVGAWQTPHFGLGCHFSHRKADARRHARRR